RATAQMRVRTPGGSSHAQHDTEWERETNMLHQLWPLAEQETSNTNMLFVGILIFVLIVLLVIFAILFQFIGLYVRATVSGARVSFVDLLGMRLRKVNALAIVNARIQASRAGIAVATPEMESHVLAGGDVQRVINAMIAAIKANIDLPWKTATAIDLAG